MPTRAHACVGGMLAMASLVSVPQKAHSQGSPSPARDSLTKSGTDEPTALKDAQAPTQVRSHWRAGVRGGGHYDLLPRPADPRGEPTLLGGSAFDGLGWSAGLAGHFTMREFGPGFRLGLELGLIYAHLQGDGFIKDPETGQSQTVTFETDQLHLPLLLRLEQAVSPLFGWFVGLGPQLFLGLNSQAGVETRGVGDAPRSVDTTEITHLGLAAGTGVFLDFGSWRLPLELRFGWDPMMPSSTRERFKGYTSLERPGAYQVGFTWQSGVLVGIDVPL